MVAENAKQRFALKEEPDPSSGEPVLWIRANQGHSVAVEDLELVRIGDPDEIPYVVHGTFTRHWESIRKSVYHSSVPFISLVVICIEETLTDLCLHAHRERRTQNHE